LRLPQSLLQKKEVRFETEKGIEEDRPK
jgi:hypothetical protein